MQIKLQINKCHTAFESLQKDLEAHFSKLNSEISALKQKYLDELVAMEVGFKHKLDEIVWMEYFIKFQQDKIRPVDYINKYFTHLEVQEEFIRNLIIPEAKDLGVVSR